MGRPSAVDESTEMKMDMTTLLWIGGAAVVLYYLSQQSAGGAATPLSIYPSLAWTATTSMAKTPKQQASTVVPASSLFSSTQTAAQNALFQQCAGSYPGCTPLLGDTQLGF